MMNKEKKTLCEELIPNTPEMWGSEDLISPVDLDKLINAVHRRVFGLVRMTFCVCCDEDGNERRREGEGEGEERQRQTIQERAV